MIGKIVIIAAIIAGGETIPTTVPHVSGIECPITMIGTITPAPAHSVPMILGTGIALPAAINAPAVYIRLQIVSLAMVIIEEELPTVLAIMVISMWEYPIAKPVTIIAPPAFPILPIV